jgi:hypothetical protein
MIRRERPAIVRPGPSFHVVVNSARYVRGEPKIAPRAPKPMAVHAV